MSKIAIILHRRPDLTPEAALAAPVALAGADLATAGVTNARYE